MYRPYADSLADSGPYADVESIIRGQTQDFATSFNTGNYDQVARLFAPDGVFMAPHQEPALGPKPVERALQRFGELGYQNLRLETMRVDSSGDMAMEIGRYTVVVAQANGSTVLDRGKYVKVWRRLGAWLIVADCWSSNLPATAAAAQAA